MKPKSKKKAETQHDFILLDRSGSMGSLWAEAINSVNAYAKKLADEKVDTKITLAAFDGNGHLDFQVLRDSLSPKDWNPVTSDEATPRGMTPLNDATGKIVAMANAKAYDKVAIIIMTDGHENASKELSVVQAKKLLDECRAKNWQVIFLGANFDNASQAANYGNFAQSTISSSPRNLKAAMMSTGNLRASYSATGKAMAFTDAEKRKMAEQ